MRKYKIIFSDVDGTLLDDSLKIPPKTKSLLADLAGNGIMFVPVSARMPSTMTPVIDSLGINTPMIAYSGALTLDESGNTISDIVIPPNTALDIYGYITSDFKDVNISVYYGPDWIVDDISDPRVQVEIKVVELAPTQISIPVYISKKQKLHKMFCIGSPKRTSSLTDELNKRYPGIFACKSRDIFIEIINSGASKENAVSDFCKLQGIDTRSIIAFGDHHNDAGMLKLAGLGIAMGNATSEVKLAADRVTTSNNDEGIYDALRRLLAAGDL